MCATVPCVYIIVDVLTSVCRFLQANTKVGTNLLTRINRDFNLFGKLM